MSTALVERVAPRSAAPAEPPSRSRSSTRRPRQKGHLPHIFDREKCGGRHMLTYVGNRHLLVTRQRLECWKHERLEIRYRHIFPFLARNGVTPSLNQGFTSTTPRSGVCPSRGAPFCTCCAA